MRRRDAGAGGEGRRGGRRGQVVVDRGIHRLHDPTDGHVAVGQTRGEPAVLADRHQRGLQVRAEERGDLVGTRVLGQDRRREVGAHVEAVAADHSGLAAVHGPDGPGHVLGQPGLAHQRQLAVEHHARRAAGDGRGGRVATDAAAHPHRQAEVDDLLEQDGCLGGADPAAGLAPRGDEPADARRLRRPGLVERHHLGHDLGHDRRPGIDVGRQGCAVEAGR